MISAFIDSAKNINFKRAEKNYRSTSVRRNKSLIDIRQTTTK